MTILRMLFVNHQHMTKHSKNISLAILSGGKASRLGGISKALIEYKSQPFVSMIYNELSPIFSETIIISNSPEEFTFLDVPVFKDIYQQKGPLGGIHSALKNAKGKAVFIVSCDMPFVKLSVAKRLLSEFNDETIEAVIPTINENMEPLFGIYCKSGVDIVERMLSAGKSYSIRKYLNLINTVYIDIPLNKEFSRCFTNVNTPNDLDRIRRYD